MWAQFWGGSRSARNKQPPARSYPPLPAHPESVSRSSSKSSIDPTRTVDPPKNLDSKPPVPEGSKVPGDLDFDLYEGPSKPSDYPQIHLRKGLNLNFLKVATPISLSHPYISRFAKGGV